MDYSKRNNFLLLLVSGLILLGCTANNEDIDVSIKPIKESTKEKSKSLEFFVDFDSIPKSPVWNVKNHLTNGDKNKFEHFKADDLYGTTFELIIPDSFAKKSIELNVGLKYRALDTEAGKFVTTVKGPNGKGIVWDAKSLAGPVNEWQVFEQTTLLPANRPPGTKLKFYSFNPQKTQFDVDSISISISPKQFPSYLTDIKENLSKFPKQELKNELFEWVKVASFLNDELVETFISTEGEKLHIENDYFDMISEINLNRHGYLLQSKTNYKKPTKVNRLAMIYKYKGEVTEVYRNNKSATEILGNEVWIGREGFKLDVDSNSWIAYQIKSNISSCQILKDEKLLIVNYDWSQDHPLLHFPELDSAIGQHEDLSANTYTPKDGEIQSNLWLEKAHNIKSMPRILPTRNGFQSAFLWTEHADFSDIRLHKVTYFGNEEATGPATAKGGFGYHNIPVTKSVFYTVNDTLNNHHYTDSRVTSTLASVRKTPGFETFLDTLYANGNEICLHTPDFYTSNEDTMRAALEYITKRYGSHTWIDHGYNNGHSDNREDFMCDGLNSYSVKLWEEFGIKYFWNGYFEDAHKQNDFRFVASNLTPYHGFEDHLPYPLYWQNKSTPTSMYSWKTNSVFFPINGGSWNYYFSDKRLKDFTQNYGIEFSHVYPAHTGHPGFWKYDEDSNFVIQPEFDLTLQKMANLRDQGILSIPTVGEFMEYQEILDWIHIGITIDGGIKVSSAYDEDIKGITLVVKKDQLSPGFEKQFKGTRVNGDDMIFWFDVSQKGDFKFFL